MLTSRTRLLALGVAIAAGLLALGAKLVLIRSYGSDVPFFDEWDAIGRVLVIPDGAGRLTLADFFLPQNEHRIVLSRLLSFGLLRANGQWDPLLEMAAGAVLHSSFLVALLLFARRIATGARFTVVALLTTLLFVLAYDWENTLQGLQSAFYFLEWSALGMFLLCVPSAPLSRGWCLGFLVGIAGLGTMSSGFFAAGVVLVLQAVRCILARRIGWKDRAAAALLAGLCVCGYLAISHPPGNELLRAESPWDWVVACATALSWPDLKLPVACVVLQLPILVLVARRIRERRIEGNEAVLFALAAWTWIQLAAIAFARGNHGMVASPRYMDLYALGSAANLLAIAILSRSGPGARLRVLLGVLWISLFTCGLWDLEGRAFSEYLEQIPARKAAERQNMKLFLATGEASVLEKANPLEVPYPNPPVLASLLTYPAIREALPVGIRPSDPLTPEAGSAGFRPAPLAQLQPGAAGRVWIAHGGPARFVSEPLPSRVLPYLHFSVAGSPDLSASALHLESAGEAVSAPNRRLLGEEWIPFDLPVPDFPMVRVVVDVPAGDHWLAFSGPVEEGRGSWANHWLLRRSGALERAAGVLLACAMGALLFVDSRRTPARSQTSAE